MLNSHEKICRNHEYYEIVMSDEDIKVSSEWKVVSFVTSLMVSFVTYVDFKFLLEKMNKPRKLSYIRF